MTLQDFINLYKDENGVGNTPQNKGQCVGLISLWMDNLGVAHEYGNAKDLLANADTNKFDIIYNDPNNLNQFPLPGDIMVFDGSWGGGFGHTGVVVTANGDSFTLFEQNDVRADDPNGACEILPHANYKGVAGWLHFKLPIPAPQPTDDPLQACLAQHTVLVTQATQKDAQIGQLQTTVTNLNQQINDRNNDITKLNGDKDTLGKQIVGLEQQVATLEPLAKQVPGLKQLVEEADTKIQGYRDNIATLNNQIAQFKLTSISTMSSQELIRELVKRIFNR